MSLPFVFDFNLTMEGGEGERELYFQHRQLHRIFITILCTAIYSADYACPSMLLYVPTSLQNLEFELKLVGYNNVNL